MTTQIITQKSARGMGLGKCCEDCQKFIDQASKNKAKKFLIMEKSDMGFHIIGITAEKPEGA